MHDASAVKFPASLICERTRPRDFASPRARKIAAVSPMSSHSIAFIGTGVMGRSMAGHLLKAGHTLHVFNRTKAKAQPLLDAGARWHETAGAATARADFVFTIVGFPTDVEETYFGPGGVLASAKRG